MREIKFRAWDKLKKSMHDVGGINFIEGIVILWKQTGSVRSTYYAELDSIELVEYTGRKDKNAVEIYEGDVVFIEEYDGPGETYVVNYKDAEWRLVNGPKVFDEDSLHLFSSEELEIKGNIYENKDLMEDGQG